MATPDAVDVGVRVPLGRGAWALVDQEDASLVTGLPWRLSAYGYASTRDGRMMHRLVLAAPPDTHVDHINGDRLDNRRANLRLASRCENARNVGRHRDSQAPFKGVFLHTRPIPRRWQARIYVGGRRRSLGYFATAEEAARAYDRAAREHFGAFARLNFPETT